MASAAQENLPVMWRRITRSDAPNAVRITRQDGIKLSGKEAEVSSRILRAGKVTGNTESTAVEAIAEVESSLSVDYLHDQSRQT